MVLLVVLIPVGLMFFALLMQNLEHRLQRTTVSRQDVEEFLDAARPDEVDMVVAKGWRAGLAKFRRRLRSGRPSRRRRRMLRHQQPDHPAIGDGTLPHSKPSGP